MNNLDRNNLEFIKWTLKNEGFESLRIWFTTQEEYVQAYVISLLKTHSYEILDTAQELSGNLSDARSVLKKFVV